MIYFKACKRCKGDLKKDWDGEIHCLQCGHIPETKAAA